MRSVIALLLFSAAISIGGCDRQSAGRGQAGQGGTDVTGTAATSAAKGAQTDGNARAIARMIDRSHRGERAPDIVFRGPDGARMTLAALRGRPVLLNLWATWCPPCVAEMPTLDALAVREGDRLHVVPLSQDLEGIGRVNDFFTRARFASLQPYLDDRAAFSAATGGNLPTTILYDARGREVWRLAGGLDWTSAAARRLIAEGR